ncbi:hypothetical protein KIN20_010895 [Parelaphostrongylus tenuis]|uniref:Uncharacterized protein n=1 Tax=Parelaphostrongylus tenuis TaxID=148309 RepID=A0AAD5MR87_PARTN|nr:hypothetical protein KIN20_010895 [Parelaphostrongylus tenuis]
MWNKHLKDLRTLTSCTLSMRLPPLNRRLNCHILTTSLLLPFTLILQCAPKKQLKVRNQPICAKISNMGMDQEQHLSKLFQNYCCTTTFDYSSNNWHCKVWNSLR